MVREGQRTLDTQKLLDYRAAKPTHKPKPAKTMTVTATDGTTATIEVTDVKVSKVIRDGPVSAYSMAIANATTPKPLPKADTSHGLLARLNANLRDAK